MKHAVRLAWFFLLSFLAAGAAHAQDYDDLDEYVDSDSPPEPLTRGVQGALDSLALESPGAEPRAVLLAPRTQGGPWRFLVTEDETALVVPDEDRPAQAVRRMLHVVLLVEARPGEHEELESSYGLLLEQVALDFAVGSLEELEALPATDPTKPVPARDETLLYQRVLPLATDGLGSIFFDAADVGARGELIVTPDGWLRTCAFEPGDAADDNARAAATSVARLLGDVCLPLPRAEVGAGAAWRFIADEVLDGEPAAIERRVELERLATASAGLALRQSFIGEAQPDRSPGMFAGLDGEAQTFGSVLKGQGRTTWGSECPVPLEASLEWTEDCTGTFETAEANGSPARTLNGRTHVLRSSKLRFLAEPLPDFVP